MRSGERKSDEKRSGEKHRRETRSGRKHRRETPKEWGKEIARRGADDDQRLVCCVAPYTLAQLTLGKGLT